MYGYGLEARTSAFVIRSLLEPFFPAGRRESLGAKRLEMRNATEECGVPESQRCPVPAILENWLTEFFESHVTNGTLWFRQGKLIV